MSSDAVILFLLKVEKMNHENSHKGRAWGEGRAAT
jgi:hypothetical protein